MWDQRRRPKRTNLHMPRNEIVKCWRAAAIRHLGKLDAGNVREPLDHDVLLAAGSSPERVVQPRLLLRKGYQLSNRICQSASKFDPRSASNFDPLERRVRAVALAPSELVGVAETARARVVW